MNWLDRARQWPAHRLSSYEPCKGCGSHCDLGHTATPQQPCWGMVLFWYGSQLGDRETGSAHRCLGHVDAKHYEPLAMAPKGLVNPSTGPK